MASALCTTQDVATLLMRPVDGGSDEEFFLNELITRASDLLRNAVPSIDVRISRYITDPTDRGAVSPMTAATVVANAVKRYIRNPDGFASQSVGPYSVAYALRTEKEQRGVLSITSEDLAILFPNRKRPRAGTIRTRPALAPRPVGRYGPLPGAEQVLETVIDWSAHPPVDGGEVVEITAASGPDGSTS